MRLEGIIRSLVRIIMKGHLLIVAAATILAIAAAPRAVHLLSNIDTDLTELLPDSFTSVRVLKEVRGKFKFAKSMDLVIENSDPKKARAFVDALAKYLESDPLVESVESRKRGFEFFDKHKLLFVNLDDLRTIRDQIDRRIQREKLGSLYVDFEDVSSGDEEFSFGDIEEKYKDKYSVGIRSEYYTNDTETIYTIYVRPKKEVHDIADSKAFYARIATDVGQFKSASLDKTTKVHFTGGIRSRVDEYETLIKDLGFAGIVSGIGIFLVLLAYFRRPLAAGIIFMPLVMGILSSFAFSSFFVRSLNLITSFLFAILGGLGVEIGIHMLARYIEERRATLMGGCVDKDKAREEALFAVIYHTGTSALTSAATVAATFFILIINDFKGFSEFGFIAGFGLVINFLCYIVVFPSILILAERLHVLGFRRGIGFDRIGKGKEGQRLGPHVGRFPVPRFALAGLVVLAIVTIISLPRVKFEWRFSKIKAVIPAAQEAKLKQRETSKSVNNPAVVIIHNKLEADAVKKAIEAQKEKTAGRTVVNAYRSYYDLMPDDQFEKISVIDEIESMLADDTLKLVKGERKKDIDRFREALAETTPIKEAEIPQGVREIFKGTSGETGSELAYINPLPKLELDDGRNAIKFAEEIETIKAPVGDFHPSSDAIVFADVLRTMISDGKRVVVLAFIIVFLIVWLDFRKIGAAALVVSPIVLGILFTFGIMYVLDLRLNFYNIVVIPISVGTSIDNSIHLYHRYRELGPGSLLAALKSSGGAALTSSLTNIFGFLGLVFTSHNGLRSIGDLAVVGLVACLLTTLVYFPALLQVLEDRRTNQLPFCR